MNIILIVSMIEPVRVLKTEFFSRRLETRPSVLLSDLKSEVCSARVEARVRVLLSDLKSEVCSAKPETAPSEALRVIIHPGVVILEAEETVVSVTVAGA